MHDYNRVPIIQCSYQFNLKIQKLAANFPQNYRHTIGRRLAEDTASLFTDLIAANYIRSLDQRAQALENLARDLFILSQHIRTAKDLKIISLAKHSELSSLMLNIRYQLDGWKNWAAGKT